MLSSISSRMRKILLILFFPFGILLLLTSSKISPFIERVYSNWIYKLISQVLSLFTGLLPFSIAEVLIFILAFLVIGIIIRAIFVSSRMRRGNRSYILGLLTNLLISASLIYFGFVLLWGLNYSRLPFAQIAGFEVRPASVNELAGLCESIINQANHLRSKVRENDKGIMLLTGGKQNALKDAYKGYEKAAEIFPELGGKYGRPKGVILSEAMCYTGITGVYFPFTAEANVNMLNNDSMLPSTICHEMAHQRGFAREDEANYIAYAVCAVHPDIDFQYSGQLLALIHSMNALYSYDQEKYRQLALKYDAGIRRDLADISEFWKKYEGPVEEISSSINNAYLKSNMQKDGIYSYGRMVDLLIAEHRSKNGKN